MTLMKALIKTTPEHAEIQTVPIPVCGPGEVLVRVRSAALCGTDLHILDWNSWARGAGIKLPFILGHECCGDVVKVGEGVKGLQLGDKIAVETHVPCGQCDQCLTGAQHICHNLKLFGIHMNGCFAEYALVPAICARKIPAAIDYDVGSVMEPAGTALRTALDTGVGGSKVVILGCGPIGLFAVASAAALGADRIIATDVSSYRLDLARRMGADQAFNPLEQDVAQHVLDCTNGHGADVVIEASGSITAIRQAFRLLKKGGTVALIGLPGESVELEIGRDIVFKEAKVLGIHGRKMFHTWSKLESLLSSDKLQIKPAITHAMPLDNWQEGIQLAKSGEACKIIFHP